MGICPCHFVSPPIILIGCILFICPPIWEPSSLVVAIGDDLLRSQLNDDFSNNPDPCEACRLLVKSFEKGLEKTNRGKHEGGDTSWEERNLKSYPDSEVRLVEIQEGLCDDVTKGKAQCLYVSEESETDIEEWWFNHRRNNIRLHDYLCIQKLKKCCPEGSYGMNCQKCPSNCNRHGSCDGSGTREGSGECQCQNGYSGEFCQECDADYYRVHQTMNDNEFSCLPCHQACSGGCTGPRSANCTLCRKGYKRDSVTNSCVDINECELSSNGIDIELGQGRLCPERTFCVNTDGHYKCADCHRACLNCVAYGRDKCLTCANGYRMDDERNCMPSYQPEIYEPYQRDGESFVGFLWRRVRTELWPAAFFFTVVYLFAVRLVNLVNLGDSYLRRPIFVVSAILAFALWPHVHKGIVTNFGKNLNDSDPTQAYNHMADKPVEL